MTEASPFAFRDDPLQTSAEQWVARIAPGVTDVQQLLQHLSEGLQFPEYFGFNWDALSDCLRDLHWLDRRIVVIQHGDVPALATAELRIYFEVLEEAVCSWKPEEQHRLQVVFPGGARQTVAGWLK